MVRLQIYIVDNLLRVKDLGGKHSIGAPIQVYPLYENAFRAARKQSIAENAIESSKLYEDFARIASQNPMAWFYGKEPATAESIRTVTQRNRMICFPCMMICVKFIVYADFFKQILCS